MGDQTRGNRSADESLQVGGNVVQFLVEIRRGGLAVLGLLDNCFGEAEHDLEIGRRDIKTHGDLGSVDDGLSLLAILTDHLGQVMQLFVVECLLVADSEDKLGVGKVVGLDTNELGKVPAVPLPDAHEELIDTLILEIDSGAGLDDVVIVPGDAELDLGTGVGVAHTQTGTLNITGFQVAEKLLCVETNTADDIGNNIRGIGGFAGHAGEDGLDATGQVLLRDTKHDLGLLARGLREVQLEDVLEVI